LGYELASHLWESSIQTASIAREPWLDHDDLLKVMDHKDYYQQPHHIFGFHQQLLLSSASCSSKSWRCMFGILTFIDIFIRFHQNVNIGRPDPIALLDT
jgi:hypothetical protein